ncbi:MAG: SirB2 family protein [Woeseiaceae bacterium]
MKNLHMTFAFLTICGFVIRGIWMMRSSPLLQHPISRIAPHIIDTLFLVTGVAMVVQMRLAVMQNNWLLAKFAGLALYIVLGAIALRRGPTMRVRQLAFVAALLSFAYVVGAAINKSPLSWFA